MQAIMSRMLLTVQRHALYLICRQNVSGIRITINLSGSKRQLVRSVRLIKKVFLLSRIRPFVKPFAAYQESRSLQANDFFHL
jgi:hypothetical protein